MSKATEFRRRLAAGLVTPQFRYPFNTQFFEKWSADLAWITGLIWSDGCLFRNSIEVSSKDKDLMELVADLIDQPNGVRPKNGGLHWRVVFSNKRVADFFRSIGLTPAKSHIAPWPKIPEELYPAFVRGLLDGDGSVQRGTTRPGQQAMDIQVSWCGAAPDLAIGLCGWLDKMNLRFGVRFNGNTWRIFISQQDSLRRLYNLMYPATNVPCLKRKRDTYDEWISTPRFRTGRPSVK